MSTRGGPVDGGSGGGDDGGMEERLKSLERAVAVIEAKLPDLATNDGVEARLAKTETKIILWIVGVAIASGVVGRFLAPAPSAPTSQPPIVIQVPSAQTSPTPATAPPQKP